MSFGIAGRELADAAPVTEGTETFATPAASSNKNVSLTDGDLAQTTKSCGSVGGAGDGASASSSLVTGHSAGALTRIWCEGDAKAGGVDPGAGPRIATTMMRRGEGRLETVGLNDLHLERSTCSHSPQSAVLGPVAGPAAAAAAAKMRQVRVAVTTAQAASTSSPNSTSLTHLRKMEGSSRGLTHVPQQQQQQQPPVPIGGALSQTKSPTAVPVKALYVVPSSFYSHNSGSSSAVLSVANFYRDHGGTSTSHTPPHLFAEGSSHQEALIQPVGILSPRRVNVLVDRARRAAQLYVSSGLFDEVGAETALPSTAGSCLAWAEGPDVARSSSCSTVQVARGYGVFRDSLGPGYGGRVPSDYGEVNLVPGSKRRRHRCPPQHTGTSEGERPEQRLDNASGHGGVVASVRSVKSPPASSSSSIIFASPHSPAMALAFPTMSPSGILPGRIPVASSPFRTLLSTFDPVALGATAPSAGASVPLARAATSTAPSTQLPCWVQPWLSHALSRAMAAHIERDADATDAAPLADLATSAPPRHVGAAPQRPDSPHTAPFSPAAMTSGVSAGASPRTLKTALLLIFDSLEQLEADVKDSLFDVLSVHQASCCGHRTSVGDGCGHPHKECRSFGAALSCSATPASAPSALDRAVDHLHRLTLLWCELLSQWPCEAAMLGYVEWWLSHPAWSDLTTRTATAAPDPSTTCLVPERKESGGMRAEARDGGEQLSLLSKPQERALVLQGILAAAVTEGMHRVLDALVDAFVRSVSEVLRNLGAVGQPRGTAHTPPRNTEPKVNFSAAASQAQHTCRELLRLLGSVYARPPLVLQQLLTLMRSSDFVSTAVDCAGPNGEEGTTTRHTDEVSSAAPGGLSSVTAGAVASDDHQKQQSRPRLFSSTHSPRHGSSGSLTSPRVGFGPGYTSELRSRVCKLHYQLLYAVCRLCNELPMLWCLQDDTRDTVGDEGANGTRPNAASDVVHFDLCLWRHREGELKEMTFFALAVQLAATVSALLLHVQLPMKGDLLCLTGRLAQWRAALLQSSCMGEREYLATMGHLCALMAQAT